MSWTRAEERFSTISIPASEDGVLCNPAVPRSICLVKMPPWPEDAFLKGAGCLSRRQGDALLAMGEDRSCRRVTGAEAVSQLSPHRCLPASGFSLAFPLHLPFGPELGYSIYSSSRSVRPLSPLPCSHSPSRMVSFMCHLD